MNFFQDTLLHVALTCQQERPSGSCNKEQIEKGESVFRCKGEILCLKHHDRREVCLLSTIHDANEILVKNRFGNHVLKPEVIVVVKKIVLSFASTVD